MTNGRDDAFPTLIVGEDVRGDTGLSKREYFASLAMQPLIATDEAGMGHFEKMAKAQGVSAALMAMRTAVSFADHLIAALNETTVEQTTNRAQTSGKDETTL